MLTTQKQAAHTMASAAACENVTRFAGSSFSLFSTVGVSARLFFKCGFPLLVFISSIYKRRGVSGFAFGRVSKPDGYWLCGMFPPPVVAFFGGR